MTIDSHHLEWLCIDEQTPIDLLEPEKSNPTELREAAITYIRSISTILDYINSSKNKTYATLGIIYALGLHNLVEGKSQRQLAKELGISHFTISRHTVEVNKRLSDVIEGWDGKLKKFIN